ncbi:MAG: hypothetical protein H7Y31_09180 [Chitinophagaceae bacterium]|nr:hypothetical protein [Chitinophagaceae bacterium]
MKLILFTLLALAGLSSCSTDSNKQVTNPADYTKYLVASNKTTHLQQVDEEIAYWNSRFTETPDDIIARGKIAGLLTQRFSYSGNIAEVNKADSLYSLVNQLNRVNSSSTYRSLATNAITQHKFRVAQAYIDTALAMGDDKYLSTLIEFDIAMELGNKNRARKALTTLENKTSFEYLIRASKYQDHVEGDLESAIVLLETALETLDSNNKNAVWLWTKSNLADLYGHANRFVESYQSYLDVLNFDHEYYHALKGIAWLAFSKDKSPDAAQKILLFLQSQHPVPDYDLILAEVAAFQGDNATEQKHLVSFRKKTSDVMYGNMYNKYLFNLHADIWNDHQEALRIAETEVAERPTGEAFSWLAWAQCRLGENEKALQTIQTYVENKCFEPDALYYAGKIYAANGNKKMARKFLEDARSSAFELGPQLTQEITEALNEL